MSLPLYSSTTVSGGGGSSAATRHPLPPQFSSFSPPLSSARTTSRVIRAANKSTPRTGKFDSKNRRNSPAAEQDKSPGRRATLEKKVVEDGGGVGVMDSFVDDGFVMPYDGGKEPDFWEGSKWDGLGFFVQYMWAFGVVFAVIACGVAVATYNEGATNFKETPVYKDSIQSKEFLEESEGSNSDVFESNPTEEAPSLE